MKRLFFVSLIIFAITLSYSQESQTFSGDYSSIMRRMDPLSCYCYNGGYLTYGKDEVVRICFSDDEEVKDGYITVTGYFKEITHTPTQMDPCPAGTELILIVESFTIEENYEYVPNIIDWSGEWITDFADMKLYVNGDYVTGSYEYQNGKIEGYSNELTNGYELKGTWTQSDAYGWLRFVIYNDDKNKFYGEWGYFVKGAEAPAKGKWNGNKK